MRIWWTGVLVLATAAAAHAEPAALVAEPAPPVAGGRVELSAAPALMSYGESQSSVDGSSTTLGLRIGGRAGVRVGRATELVVSGAWLRQPKAGMSWTLSGTSFQKNQFAMDVIDGGLGLRFRLSARRHEGALSEWYVTAGYRFSRLALHLSDLVLADPSMTPPVDHANETQLVHALPVELERVHTSGGFRYGLRAVLGPSFTTVTNDQLSGVHFSGTGFVAGLEPSIGWRAGAGWLTLSLGVELRDQDGSSPQAVTIAGMDTEAEWPHNTTWTIPLSLGYAWEAGR